jgi:hypothetical protein
MAPIMAIRGAPHDRYCQSPPVQRLESHRVSRWWLGLPARCRRRPRPHRHPRPCHRHQRLPEDRDHRRARQVGRGPTRHRHGHRGVRLLTLRLQAGRRGRATARASPSVQAKPVLFPIASDTGATTFDRPTYTLPLTSSAATEARWSSTPRAPRSSSAIPVVSEWVRSTRQRAW